MSNQDTEPLSVLSWQGGECINLIWVTKWAFREGPAEGTGRLSRHARWKLWWSQKEKEGKKDFFLGPAFMLVTHLSLTHFCWPLLLAPGRGTRSRAGSFMCFFLICHREWFKMCPKNSPKSTRTFAGTVAKVVFSCWWCWLTGRVNAEIADSPLAIWCERQIWEQSQHREQNWEDGAIQIPGTIVGASNTWASGFYPGLFQLLGSK